MTNWLNFPASSRDVADWLDRDGWELNDLVRAERIPRPPLFANRRVWSPTLVIAAAEALGVLTPERRRALQRAMRKGNFRG